MSKFFLGQRVRVVRIYRPENQHVLWAEGRIVSKKEVEPEVVYGLDVMPIEMKINGCQMVFFGFAADQLEPILPEGSAPSEFTFQQLMDNLQEVMA